MNKPTTILINELRDNLATDFNNCGLPAWVILYVLDPFVSQLNMLKEMQENEDKKVYEDSLNNEESYEAEEKHNSEVDNGD